MKLSSSLAWLLLLALCLPIARAEDLDDLIADYRAQKAEGSAGRYATLKRIGAEKSAEALRFLVGIRPAEDRDGQSAVVEALGKIGGPAALEALVDIAEDNTAESLARSRAASEVSRFKDPDPESALRRLARSDYTSVASNAINNLTNRLRRRDLTAQQRSGLVRFLLEIATDGPLPYGRSSALRGLGRAFSDGNVGEALPAEEWQKLLRRRMKDENDGQARAAAVTALAALGDAKDFPLLVGACSHSDQNVRRAAVEGLRSFEGQEKRKTALYLDAVTDEYYQVRHQAYLGLAGTRDRRAVAAASQAVLLDEYLQVREAAGKVLAASGASSAGKLLLRALSQALRDHDAGTPSPFGSTWAKLADSLTESLAAAADEKVREMLRKQARNAGDPHIRVAALRALGAAADPEADDALREAARDKDPRIAEAAIRALAAGGARDAIPLLVEMAGKRRDRRIRLAALGALGTLGAGSPEAAAAIVAALSDNDLDVLTTAADAAGRARVAEAVEALGALLGHDEWPARSAAVGALKSIRLKRSIDLLVAHMQEEVEGKIRAEIMKALEWLTGKDLGMSAEAWRTWWEGVRDTFTVPSEAEAARLKGSGSRAGYYGIPVVSRRMTFIIDISGSMGGTTRHGSGEDGSNTKMEVAKAELIKAVRNLNADAFFNVVFFDHTIDAWQKRLVPGSRRNRSAAIRKIRNLSPRGGTNIYDAVELAFTDKKVDTIFLLTDGAPGTGKFVAAADIRREVARMNRTRRITIHCIALGTVSQLLKDLAEDSNGEYVQR